MTHNRQLWFVILEWNHLLIHSLIPLNNLHGFHKCNTDIFSRDITDNDIIRNPFLKTHIKIGGDTEKKFRQNEWQVNGETCCEMMRIMHGARETHEDKKIPQCYKVLFQRNTNTHSSKWLKVCKLVYTTTHLIDWLKLKRMLLSVSPKIWWNWNTHKLLVGIQRVWILKKVNHYLEHD